MLPEFIVALQNAELAMTAEEIADTLWLALQMDSQHEESELHSPHSHVHDDLLVDPHPPSLLLDASAPEVSASVYLHTQHRRSDTISDMASIPFRSPAAVALPNALALARAIRPFMRRLPSKTAVVLNEYATVQRVAEAQMNFWMPVFEPAPIRWFDIELVVDIGASMIFWKETIAELQTLLERMGAFRDVRLWRLATDDSNSVDLYAGLHSTQVRNPKELINPGGYRLLLVVSDCISPAWHSSKVQELLNMWGQKNLVTLLQVLPRRLWSQTTLEDADIVQIYSSQSKASNQYLKIKNTLSRYDKNPQRERSLSFPVITLEPKSLLSWANVLTGAKKTWVVGAVFEHSHDAISVEETASDNQVEEDDLSPKKRVRLFQITASSLARKLAGLLAVAPIPISLPVVRQVQITMVQGASQVHIAEVFLGGLLEEIYRDEIDQNPSLIQYDFIAGVRNELINTVPVPDAHLVLKNVSQFVRDHYGQPRDFQALIALPRAEADQDMSIRKGSLPFAQIDFSALRRFGGTFSALVDKIEQKNERYRSIDHHSAILETTPEYSTSLAGSILPDPAFINQTWCGFVWTAWLPLNSFELPVGSGIYRIRAVGGNEIFFIGSTRRNLKERIGDLYRNVMKDPTQMPFSDPHTAAPALWAWRDATGLDFECSTLSLPSQDDLEILVHYFLWQYRLEKGNSTLANHGRFHPDYTKSGNSSTGRRGYRLPEGSSNPAGGPSIAPLLLKEMPLDRYWMKLDWSEPYSLIDNDFKNIEASPAVYKVMDMDIRELLFVGSTPNLRNRLQDLKQKIWNCPRPIVAFALQSSSLYSYQLAELENDLLGGYYKQMRKAPKSQFGKPQPPTIIETEVSALSTLKAEKPSQDKIISLETERIPPGSHICQLYSKVTEIPAVTAHLLRVGLSLSEKCCFAAAPAQVKELRDGLRKLQVDVEEYIASGQLVLYEEREPFLADGKRFDPYFLLSSHETFITQALREGWQAVRLSIDMTWLAKDIATPEQILKYEAASDAALAFQNAPIIALMHYDHSNLLPSLVVEMLKLHPISVVGKYIKRNPFYLNSEQYMLKILRINKEKGNNPQIY